jgi:hypothetical protein
MVKSSLILIQSNTIKYGLYFKKLGVFFSYFGSNLSILLVLVFPFVLSKCHFLYKINHLYLLQRPSG